MNQRADPRGLIAFALSCSADAVQGSREDLNRSDGELCTTDSELMCGSPYSGGRRPAGIRGIPECSCPGRGSVIAGIALAFPEDCTQFECGRSRTIGRARARRGVWRETAGHCVSDQFRGVTRLASLWSGAVVNCQEWLRGWRG